MKRLVVIYLKGELKCLYCNDNSLCLLKYCIVGVFLLTSLKTVKSSSVRLILQIFFKNQHGLLYHVPWQKSSAYSFCLSLILDSWKVTNLLGRSLQRKAALLRTTNNFSVRIYSWSADGRTQDLTSFLYCAESLFVRYRVLN